MRKGPDLADAGPSSRVATDEAHRDRHTAVDVDNEAAENNSQEAQDAVGELPQMHNGSRRSSLGERRPSLGERRPSSELNGHGPPGLDRPSVDAVILGDKKWTEDEDLEEQKVRQQKKNLTWKQTLWNAYMALGIVYGDIGTSPLYVFNNIFIQLNTTTQIPSEEDVLGATSLVIWTIILIVMIKYGCIVLLADDNQEGGTFVLYSLLSRSARLNTPGRNFHETDLMLKGYHSARSGRHKDQNQLGTAHQGPSHESWTPPNKIAGVLHNDKRLAGLLLIVVLGATAMVIGDGILTPAQSVLAAISGLGTQNAYHNIHLSKASIVGIACAVLAFLYLFQFIGTKHLSWAFSPVVVAWLLFNMLIGIYNIAHWHPGVFKAISPHYSFKFLVHNGHQGWVMLGGVLLCVTGAEAMYADLGHFTRPSIQVGLFVALLPSLLFTYLGQAAYLIRFPSAINSVYYNSLPHPIYWPMFVVATLASIVASQAMISAAFSIIRQSMTLGCFPRLRIIQTNPEIKGQIYIPEINYILMVLSIAAVGGFQTLDRIGSAYGVAVTFVFFITDILFALVMVVCWEINWIYAVSFFIFFGTLDGVYLSATLNKFTHGGWFPLAVALGIFLISAVWSWGQRHRRWFLAGNDKKPLFEFLSTDPPSEMDLKDQTVYHGHRVGLNENRLSLRRSSITGEKEGVARIAGIGLLHAESIQGVPPVFEHLLTNLPAMYKICIFVTVREVPLPHVSDQERYLVTELDYPGFYRCVCRYGYMEDVDLGPEFEQFLVQKIHNLTRPKGEWNTGFNNTLRHKIQKGKIDQAASNKVVYIMGRLEMKSSSTQNILQKILLEYCYLPMERNCRSQTDSWKVPRSRLIEVGMTYEVGSGEFGDPAWNFVSNSRSELERP